MERVRRLWAAVVEQSLTDVADEPIDSVLWNQARAFFVSGGTWAEGRQNIADLLGVHPEDLERVGRRAINARLLQEGLPPLATRTPTPCPPTQRALRPAVVAVRQRLPRLVATFKEPEPEPDRRDRTGGWRKRYAFNPFDPWRKLPSEERSSDAA